LNVDEATNYVPTTPQIPEVNEALEATLEDLKSTSSVFNQTIQIVGNQWDESSRTKVAEHPQLLRILDAQIASGVYAIIEERVQYEKALGRLAGLNDLEAYIEVERSLQATKPQINQTNKTVQPVQQQVSTVSKDARRQAAPIKQAPAQVDTSPNTAAMSDTEFKKFMASHGIL
jgi:archaellum component FlaC